MNKIVDKKNSIINIVYWLIMALITIGAFFCNYNFTLSGSLKAIMWILWFVSVLGVGMLTVKGRKIYFFAQEAKIEIQKVVWPTRQETIQTTTIVMVMVAVTGFILWLLDSVIMWVIAKITHLG